MKIKRLGLILAAVSLVLVLASCAVGGGTTASTTTAEAPAKYNVTFAGVDTAIPAQEIEEGKKAVAPAEPTKDGFTFDGWFVGENEFSFDTAITADITLTAKWTKTTFTVSFEGVEENDQIIDENGFVTEPAEPAEVTGYTFDGWFVGDEEYDFETAVTESFTITAKFTAIEYTITYDIPEGIANLNPATYTVESAFTFVDLIRENYQFGAWSLVTYDELGVESTEPISAIVEGSTGDIVLRASWAKVVMENNFEREDDIIHYSEAGTVENVLGTGETQSIKEDGTGDGRSNGGIMVDYLPYAHSGTAYFPETLEFFKNAKNPAYIREVDGNHYFSFELDSTIVEVLGADGKISATPDAADNTPYNVYGLKEDYNIGLMVAVLAENSVSANAHFQLSFDIKLDQAYLKPIDIYWRNGVFSGGTRTALACIETDGSITWGGNSVYGTGRQHYQQEAVGTMNDTGADITFGEWNTIMFDVTEVTDGTKGYSINIYLNGVKITASTLFMEIDPATLKMGKGSTNLMIFGGSAKAVEEFNARVADTATYGENYVYQNKVCFDNFKIIELS